MPGDGGALTAEEVVSRLEEAGAVLLAMGGRGAGPGPVRAQSQGWPVVHAAIESYGWTGAAVRPAVPDAAAISRMDEALSWIGLIPRERYVLRRIVGARCLVAPATGRHLYSWQRIAGALGADARAVRRWHGQGIAMIVEALGRCEAA